MKFRIVGADRQTGEDIEIVVDARDEVDAETIASRRNIMVSSVVLVRSLPREPQQSPPIAAKGNVKHRLRIGYKILILFVVVAAVAVVSILAIRSANKELEETLRSSRRYADLHAELQAIRTRDFLPDIVTKIEYIQIRHGMSYSEVVSIIGSRGEETASNRMEGVPGVMESVYTVMYSWQNRDGSNMNAMFQNDKLVNKAQFGLK